MYRAIKNIGGYKIGEIVPDREAEVWLEMYAVPHVEEISEDKESEVVEPEEPMEDEGRGSDNLLDDYLARNQSVVKKNLIEDGLSEYQLKKLLELEESDRKRPFIINTIKRLLRKK